MTVVEALLWCEDFEVNILTVATELQERHRLALDAMSVAKAAIACRIPVEPVPHMVNCDYVQIGNAKWRKGTTVHKCPCCDMFVTRMYKFCSHCGQALKWEKDDGN